MNFLLNFGEDKTNKGKHEKNKIHIRNIMSLIKVDRPVADSAGVMEAVLGYM